ncbi:hypothetical protein Acr_13g0010470 [Actinidia rufa]|uniref:Retrotransposon Copia-like N-terminal domain-containing protein n=1 Tax=Actinidia rufa TaxID=165716 RepID=A0A7J0FP01_9ERIC|nr:hypothetical protein Acr_13g0010470 [Actinidia rufa]
MSGSDVDNVENVAFSPPPHPDFSLSQHTPGARITCELLNGKNFAAWSRSVRLFLGGKGKSGWLLGTITKPNATDPKFVQWEIDNCTILGWLFNSMEPRIYHVFMYHDMLGQRLWSTAQSVHGSAPGQRLGLTGQRLALSSAWNPPPESSPSSDARGARGSDAPKLQAAREGSFEHHNSHPQQISHCYQYTPPAPLHTATSCVLPVADQVEGDVPREYISEQSLNEEASGETSERDYNGGTNERVPKATGRGQKKRPEKRSQEGGHRGQKKRRDKKNCPRNKAQDQSLEAATTAMMAMDESDVLLAASTDEDMRGTCTDGEQHDEELLTVRFRMTDGRSMKVTGVRHVSLRCKRSDEALKLVEEHSEIRSGTGAQGDALGYVRKSGQTRKGATNAGCPWRSSEERDIVDGGEMESRRLVKRRTLQRTPVRGAGHLSEKVQALRFGSAVTSMGSEVARG